MRTRWIWLLAVMTMPVSAAAQDLAELKRCTLIQSDAQRLACLDAALKPLAVDASPSKWTIDEKTDPIDGTKRAIAVAQASPPHGQHAAVFVRCINGNVDVLFAWNKYLGSEEHPTIRWKVDSAAITSEKWWRGGGGRALYVTNRDPFLAAIAGGKILYVNLSAHDQASETVTFEIAGADVAVRRIQDACPNSKPRPKLPGVP